MADLSKITLPNGTTYDLKDVTGRTIAGSQTPLQTKTYTGVYVSGNNDPNGYLYYAKVQPTSYTTTWKLTFKVSATMAGISEANGSGAETSYVTYYGARNSILGYRVWNEIRNTSYYPYYEHLVYRAKEAGITAGKGHALGFRFYSSYSPTSSTYARTITIEVLEKENCEVTFLDSMVLYANWDGTGSTNYDGRSGYNGYTQGWTFSGDRNDAASYVTSAYTLFTAGTNGIKQYGLMMQDSSGNWQSLTTDNGAGTGKTKNPSGFRLGKIFYTNSSSNFAAGALISTSVVRSYHASIDLRYSFNITATQLTANEKIYLKGTLTNGLFYLASPWWTQTEPTSDDGYVYIFLGYSRLNGTNTYQMDFMGWQGAYWYKNGCFQEMVPSSYEAQVVNGHTVNADVPSDLASYYKMPAYQTGTGDQIMQTKVALTRANRLAFLPADQIIIEQTTDGGVTWTDAGVSDNQKSLIFSGYSTGGAVIPLLNGAKSTNCGLRFTITGMKYDVPAGTPETEKYNYWNSNYILSTERYCSLDHMWFWLSGNSDAIRCQVYRATGAASTNWVTCFDTDFPLKGWSGSDWVSFPNSVFGGGTNQTTNYWNWRIVFWSRMNNGATEFQSTTAQQINRILGYGENVWIAPNTMMQWDHMYSVDVNKHVTFPANVTATNFVGKINGYTVSKDVPSNAVFTDTTYTANNGITLSGTIFGLTSGVVTAGSAGPTAAVTGNNGTTVAIPRITVDTYGRVTGLTSYNLTNVNIDHIPSAWCETAASTAAKVGSCTNYNLLANSYTQVLISTANTAQSALTLNINSKGAKPIYINGTASSSSNYTLPAGTYIVYYDGTNYYFRTDGVLPVKVMNAGSTNNPVYFSDGVPIAGTYSIGNDEDMNVLIQWDDGRQVIVAPTDPGDIIPISNGGTGASTAANARTNLGLGSAATYSVVSSVNNDSNLPTGAAVKLYADNAVKVQPVAFGRNSSADHLYGDGGIRHFLASSSMSTSKPTFYGSSHDGVIIHAAWDSDSGYETQLAISNVTGNVAVRSQNSGTWGAWHEPNTNTFIGTCSTAANTATKEVTLTNGDSFHLVGGVVVGVKYSNSNTASNVKINVQGSGAKSIWWDNAVYAGSESNICGYADRTTYYMYNGTYWVWLSHGGTTAIANGGTGATDASGARTNLGLDTLTQTKSFTYEYTIAANGSLAVTASDLEISSVSGYKAIGLSDYTSGNNSVVIRAVYGSNTSGNIIVLRNVSGSSVSATVSVTQLYIRNI